MTIKLEGEGKLFEIENYFFFGLGRAGSIPPELDRLYRIFDQDGVSAVNFHRRDASAGKHDGSKANYPSDMHFFQR